MIAFFALVFGPGVPCNALFHLGAGVLARSWCPGMLTSVLLYLPLSALLGALALREGLIAAPVLGLALGGAAAFHALEVGHNVFERW